MRTQALFGIIAVVFRAATLVFQSLVIGGIVFHRCIARPSKANGKGYGLLLIKISAGALVCTQLLNIAVNTAVLNQSLGLAVGEVVMSNFFLLGVASIIVSLSIVATPTGRLSRPGGFVMLCSFAILVCSVLTSHAISRMHDRVFLVAFTAVHQCAAAVWIGGLPQLWAALREADPESESSIARWFPRLALISVLALVTSGVAMSLRYIDTPAAVYGTSYGIMLGVKILFLAVLLLIGAINRSLLRSSGSDLAKFRLRRLLEAEVGIGITAILAAASLTSQPPAIDLKLGRVSPHEIYQRMKPVWPRLGSPRLSEVSASTVQETKLAQRAGLPLPPVPPNTPGDIAWSEYNHHWAGIFVGLAGLMGALAQKKTLKVFRYWPLMFAALAVFILLRADPEGWPLGPDSFWEAIQNGEVLQHKAFALLAFLFAAFELRVQLGKTRVYAGYVFPAVCALGGALLLTHSHGLNNIKEQFLAELSHAPIAVAAVLAGWSRWLQVRLPPAEGGLLSRVWPACFVVIGALLFNYREA